MRKIYTLVVKTRKTREIVRRIASFEHEVDAQAAQYQERDWFEVSSDEWLDVVWSDVYDSVTEFRDTLKQIIVDEAFSKLKRHEVAAIKELYGHDKETAEND